VTIAARAVNFAKCSEDVRVGAQRPNDQINYFLI